MKVLATAWLTLNIPLAAFAHETKFSRAPGLVRVEPQCRQALTVAKLGELESKLRRKAIRHRKILGWFGYRSPFGLPDLLVLHLRERTHLSASDVEELTRAFPKRAHEIQNRSDQLVLDAIFDRGLKGLWTAEPREIQSLVKNLYPPALADTLMRLMEIRPSLIAPGAADFLRLANQTNQTADLVRRFIDADGFNLPVDEFALLMRAAHYEPSHLADYVGIYRKIATVRGGLNGEQQLTLSRLLESGTEVRLDP